MQIAIFDVLLSFAHCRFKVKSSTKSKTGFRTGKAKDSIFRSPDGVAGKVGVVNSGKSMTSFGERQRHQREQ